MRTPLLWVATAWGAGVALCWGFPTGLGWVLAAAGLSVAGVRALARNPEARAGVVLLICVMLGGYMRAWVDARMAADAIAPQLTAEPQPIVCRGVIASDVEMLQRFGWGSQYQAWFALTSRREGGPSENWVACSGRVRLRWPAQAPALAYGDRVQLFGTIHAPRTTPDFDETGWLWIHQADGILTVPNAGSIQRLPTAPSLWAHYRRWIAGTRDRLKQLGHTLLSPEAAGYWDALLLGDGRGISKSLQAAFRNTGTIHVLVVSGFQVSLLGSMAFTLFSLLRFPRIPQVLAVIALLLVYGLLSGANPPIVRSTITGILVCLGLLQGRSGSALNSVGAAALLMLVVQPRTLADISFQLSFSALMGLLAVTPWLEKRLLTPPEKPGRWHTWILQPTIASLGAWLAVSPFVAWYFHQVNPIALVVNLFVVPWVSILIGAGVAAAVIGQFHPAWALPWAICFDGLSHLLTHAMDWVSQCPGGYYAW